VSELSIDAPTLAVLWTGAALGGFAAGVGGFAFAIIASAVWLHAIDPVHTTLLIVCSGMVLQTTLVWSIRRSIDFGRLWPFLLGAALGVPIGVYLLVTTDAGSVKFGLGIVLICYGLYALAAPKPPPVTAGGRPADGAVGFVGGVIGGMAGFAGILPAIWTQIRGWPKDTARGVYQCYIVFAHVVTLVCLGGVALDRTALVLLGLELPVLLAGAAAGWSLFGRLDERAFRLALALLVLLSGAGLVL